MELLTRAETNLLNVNHTKLLNNLYLSEEFFSLMLENRSFTDSMVDEIKHAGPPKSQNAKLLRILPCRPRKALQTFIRALVFTDQEALAHLLNTNLASKFVEERDRSRKGETSSSQPTPDLSSSSTSILLPTPTKPTSPVKASNPPPSDKVVLAHTSLPSEKSPPKPRLVTQPSGGGATPAAESECPMDVENNLDDDIIKSLKNLDPDTLRIDSCLNQSDIVDELNCSVKKGFAFIINNMGREVAEHIAITFAAIPVFFDNMSFKDTILLSDVSLDELRGEIRKHHGRISSSDAFVVYFLGRGNSLETVFMSSPQAVSIHSDFLALFSEDNLPSLRKKPKLFVFHIAQLELSSDESVDIDLVDANVNDDSFWNDTIIFRTLSAVSYVSDEESEKSKYKFVLPFYGFVMVAKKYMGALSTYEVLLKVRQILTLFQREPSNGIVDFALRQTPPTAGVPPLSLFERRKSFDFVEFA